MLSGFIMNQAVTSHLSQYYSPIPQTHPGLQNFINPLWITFYSYPYAIPHTQLMYTAQRLVRLRILEGIMLGPTQGSVSQDLLSRPLAGLNVSSESPLLVFRSLINLSTLSMDPFQSCSFAYGRVRLAVISFYSCPCLDHTEHGAEFWLLRKQQPLEKTTAVSFSVACAGEFNWEEGFFTTYRGCSGFSAS